MRRIFCPSENISGGKITITDDNQIHHIKNVLRCKIGEEISVFDEKGNNYCGVIEKFLPHSCVVTNPVSPSSLRGLDATASKPKPACPAGRQSQKQIGITVACAIPKRSKMEDIVDKLTQLGVERIIPMRTERVIVKLDAHKEKLRLERWKKVALNAVEQCKGCSLPVIGQVMNIEEVVSQSQDHDLKLIPALIGKRTALKSVLVEAKPKNILILIGPEGDFTPGEVNLAVRAGFIPVSLGERVLRVETAAVAAVSFIKLYL